MGIFQIQMPLLHAAHPNFNLRSLQLFLTKQSATYGCYLCINAKCSQIYFVLSPLKKREFVNV
jgi:hypothetical protein